MKLIVNHITIIIISILTFIFSYGTILKCADVILKWWIRYFPGTQLPILSTKCELEYLVPSFAAFITGFTVSIIYKSNKNMIMGATALGGVYFWLFGFWSHSMLLSVPGTILVALLGFGGHFAGKNTFRHNKGDAPDQKAVR
jgi:hypothetical protein